MAVRWYEPQNLEWIPKQWKDTLNYEDGGQKSWTETQHSGQKIQNDTQKAKNDTQEAKDDTKNVNMTPKTKLLQMIYKSLTMTQWIPMTLRMTPIIDEWNSMFLK